MRLYYYIETGHRRGLDRLRRSAPVIKALERRDVDITMLTDDFRAGEYAKEQFGIRKYVSVDVVRNIANIAAPADRVVIDSDSESLALLSEMADYYGKLVHISDEPEAGSASSAILSISGSDSQIVDPRYFEEALHSLGEVYFWGDDDYGQELAGVRETFEGLGISLLEGYYFFLQYAGELRQSFETVYESESYDEVLKSANRFITSSPQSALEALAAGSAPIFVKKSSTAEFWCDRLAEHSIPVLEAFDRNGLIGCLERENEYKKEYLNPQGAHNAADKIYDFLI